MVFILFISLTVNSVLHPEPNGAFSQELTTVSDSTLKTGWYFLSDMHNGYKRKLDRSSKIFYINPMPVIRPHNIISVELYQSNDSTYALLMKLDKRGTMLWQQATFETIGHHLAFVVDDILVYTPKVNSSIDNGIASLNRGVYSKEELEKIKQILDTQRK